VNVHQREGKCLVGVHAPSPKARHERFALQQIVGVADGVHALEVRFDAIGVEQEGVLLCRFGVP